MDETKPTPFPIWISTVLVHVNIFLSITATLGNVLILVALYKESSLHRPTKDLFRCLAVTDLGVGVITQPLYVVFLRSLSSTASGQSPSVTFYADKLNDASSFVFCTVSILTSTAISVDRLLALLLGLRYRLVVTSRRVRAILLGFWVIGVSFTSGHFLNRNIAFSVFLPIAILSVVTSIFSFTKMYLKLRHHQLQLLDSQTQFNGGEIPLNVAGFKKTVSSILWVQLTLLATYVPFIVMAMLMAYGRIFRSNFVKIIYYFTVTLAFLSSSVNPILYCWKIKPVREASLDTINKLKCWKSS